MSDDDGWGKLLLKSAFYLGAIALLERGCVDEKAAKVTLDGAGYSNIQTSPEHRWTGCGVGDLYHTEYIAKGPTGKPVRGVVCMGIFKSSTIRFDPPPALN